MDLNTADIVLSALAVLMSLSAIITARQTAKRQTALQERLVHLENARERDRLHEARSARLTARILRVADAHRFVVANEGRGQARAILVELDGQPILEHALVPQGQDHITELGPGAEMQYLLSVTMGAPPTVRATLSWEDDTGQSGSWSSELTVL